MSIENEDLVELFFLSDEKRTDHLIFQFFQQWPVFTAVTQLFILVPSLLGLKGNLDMCLAARLCTQANLGNMHNLREIVKMIVGNIALVQIQAIIAAVIVSIFAMTVGFITKQTFIWDHGLLLATSSICTATSSCFILGKSSDLGIQCFPLSQFPNVTFSQISS